jgi:hypothetical protein
MASDWRARRRAGSVIIRCPFYQPRGDGVAGATIIGAHGGAD